MATGRTNGCRSILRRSRRMVACRSLNKRSMSDFTGVAPAVGCRTKVKYVYLQLTDRSRHRRTAGVRSLYESKPTIRFAHVKRDLRWTTVGPECAGTTWSAPGQEGFSRSHDFMMCVLGSDSIESALTKCNVIQPCRVRSCAPIAVRPFQRPGNLRDV